jgi:predicted DNA-binding protein (MmcQ/YjbR family)
VQHAARSAEVDYAALDTVVPHPVYAAQGWVSIVCPGERTAEQVRALVEQAHARAVRAWRPGAGG